jgi:hypothetical protein
LQFHVYVLSAPFLFIEPVLVFSAALLVIRRARGKMGMKKATLRINA